MPQESEKLVVHLLNQAIYLISKITNLWNKQLKKFPKMRLIVPFRMTGVTLLSFFYHNSYIDPDVTTFDQKHSLFM